MSPGQILPWQMSLLQLESIQNGPKNLSLKFAQYQVSNSWDNANIDLGYVRLSWGWVGGLKIFDLC